MGSKRAAFPLHSKARYKKPVKSKGREDEGRKRWRRGEKMWGGKKMKRM